MAIFKRLTPDEIKQDFTHYGLFCGSVPVYYKDIPPFGCCMAVRNWWPEWLMDAADALYRCACFVGALFNPDIEPMWPIMLTGEIDK